MTEIILLGVSNLVLLALVVILLVSRRRGNEVDYTQDFDEIYESIRDINGQIQSLSTTVMTQSSILGESMRKDQEGQRRELAEALSRQRQELKESLKELTGELEKIKEEVKRELKEIQTSNIENLREVKRTNQESLDKINDTVNEKLQKTLEDRISKSFETVQTQLAEVYKGLGEMKNLASNVSDLKNVLSNVKTRGIIGEYQLEAILDEILTRDQYEAQVGVLPGSPERVDFAIKLPGTGEDILYLPIDSKFPADTYANLTQALDMGQKEDIDAARKMLRTTILSEAKSIHDKYIEPPYTTDFAIMFLPFEGLYAEVVNMGLLEELQNKYSVNIAGPSTMAAMLNSFRMGFRTLAIQKRSGEVWKILEAVKKEFGTFEIGLNKMKERLGQADSELDKLIGTRTNAINRKLREVSDTATLQEANETLGLPNYDDL